MYKTENLQIRKLKAKWLKWNDELFCILEQNSQGGNKKCIAFSKDPGRTRSNLKTTTNYVICTFYWVTKKIFQYEVLPIQLYTLKLLAFCYGCSNFRFQKGLWPLYGAEDPWSHLLKERIFDRVNNGCSSCTLHGVQWVRFRSQLTTR